MLLFALATLAVAAFGCLVAVSLDLPSRAATVIAAMVLTAASIAALVQVTLVAGAFRCPIVLTVALLLPASIATLAALCPPARGTIARSATRFRRPLGPPSEGRGPMVAVGVSATMLVVAYLNRIWVDLRIPPLDWDSNNYHLVTSANWVRSGRLGSPIAGLQPLHTPPSLAWVDSYPHQSELIDAWLALFPRSAQLTTLLQVPFAGLLVAATYGLSRVAGCRRSVAFVAAAIVGLTPITLAQVTTSYNDVVRASMLVAGWYFLVLAYRRATQARRIPLLVLSGIALGFSAAVKASSLPAVVLALLVVGCASSVVHVRTATDAVARKGSKRIAAEVTAFAIPATFIGGFWYVRTWTRWGSPFWPIGVGPVEGPVGLSGMSGGHESFGANLAAMVRGWGDGISALSSGVLYDAQHGSLGPVWLLILAPAVVVATLWWRRHRIALVTIVYPILILTLYNGTRVQPRYVLAITVAGAVAFGLIVEAIATRTPSTRRAVWPAVGLLSVALALSGWGASAAILLPNWAYAPGGGVVAPTRYSTAVSQYLAFLTSDAQVRGSADFWRDVDRVEAAIEPGAAIGLVADAPPTLLAPWMGKDFGHPLVMVPSAPTVDALIVRMRQSGVPYLLVGPGELSARLARDPSRRFEQVTPSAACLDYNSCALSKLWRLGPLGSRP